MVANLSGVDSQSIAYRKLGIVEYDQIYPAISGAAGFNIVFRPDANTPGKIRAEAIRQKKDGDLALIVVDYLQQMSSGMRAESRRVEVGQISRALKQLAMETGVPVLALSQLNRQSEGTASKAPTMAEMRESGDIEQDADVIILMHVPATREDHVEQIKEMGQACVRMTLEKNRQGKSGQVIDVAFDGARMLFRRVRDVIGGQT
jgi:replicative DNA helicase